MVNDSDINIIIQASKKYNNRVECSIGPLQSNDNLMTLLRRGPFIIHFFEMCLICGGQFFFKCLLSL